MKYDNSVVIQLLKQNYFKETGIKRNIALPSQVSFALVGDTVKIYIPEEGVISNMQDDINAFEGWTAVIKRWCNGSSIELEWGKPQDSKNGHYQRFLFRIMEFEHAYDWFTISPSNKDFKDGFLINENATYYCNQPSDNRKNENEVQGKEALLEYKFVEGKLNEALLQMVNATFIERQLPVGLFKEKVSTGTSIFTRGKSAIDLWGINKEKELLIFELKAENNKKVGIISELFFYSIFMRNVQLGIFKYEETNDILNKIIDTKRIKAFFLSPELHPLIDERVLEVLNNTSNRSILFDSISILNDDTLRSTFLKKETKNHKYFKIKNIIDNILTHSPLSSSIHSIIQGLLNDENDFIRQTQEEFTKNQLLDVIIAYILETLEDDCLSKEEISNITQLKQLFRIKEGDFLRLKPFVVNEIITTQIRKMFSDEKIDNFEAIQKVELQGLFDLSYDQFLKIYNAEAKKLIENGVDPVVLDTFIK